MASTEKEIIGAPQDQHVLLTTDNLIFSMSRYLYLHIMYRLRRRERLLDVLRRMGQRREKRPVYQDVAPNHLRAPGAMVCLAVEARDESLRLPDTSHAQRIQAILEAAAYHLEMPAFSIYLAAICHQPLHRRGGHGARPRRAAERRGREYFAVQLANQVGAPDQRGDAARGARGLSEKTISARTPYRSHVPPRATRNPSTTSSTMSGTTNSSAVSRQACRNPAMAASSSQAGTSTMTHDARRAALRMARVSPKSKR